MKKFFIFFLLSLFLVSCAHHRDVRPGANGVHRVVVRKPDRDTAEREAIDQATHYCESKEKAFAVVSEETKYTGTMDEETREGIRTASKVAAVLGGTTYSNGRRRSSSTIGTAGAVGIAATSGNDYVTTMTFKCQ